MCFSKQKRIKKFLLCKRCSCRWRRQLSGMEGSCEYNEYIPQQLKMGPTIPHNKKVGYYKMLQTALGWMSSYEHEGR
jgi:hypothetical protein